MKISAFKNILDDMQKIYPFKDNETEFELTHNPLACRDNGVTIQTFDEETGIYINLTKYEPVNRGGADGRVN